MRKTKDVKQVNFNVEENISKGNLRNKIIEKLMKEINDKEFKNKKK